MRIVTLNESVKKDILGSLLKRSPNQYTEYEATVNEIVAAVKDKGDAAVFDYTRRFDKWDVNSSNVFATREEIDEAYGQVDDNSSVSLRKLPRISEISIKSR